MPDIAGELLRLSIAVAEKQKQMERELSEKQKKMECQLSSILVKPVSRDTQTSKKVGEPGNYMYTHHKKKRN